MNELRKKLEGVLELLYGLLYNDITITEQGKIRLLKDISECKIELKKLCNE
jgi:hypothetical protein